MSGHPATPRQPAPHAHGPDPAAAPFLDAASEGGWSQNPVTWILGPIAGNPFGYGNPSLSENSANPIEYYFYRARYYEPGIGRFTQRDPLGYLGGSNQYSYTENNPIVWNDPFGFVKSCCCKDEYLKDLGRVRSSINQNWYNTSAYYGAFGHFSEVWGGTFSGEGGCRWHQTKLMKLINSLNLDCYSVRSAGNLDISDPAAAMASVNLGYKLPHLFVKLVPNDRCDNGRSAPEMVVDTYMYGPQLQPINSILYFLFLVN